MGPIGMVGPEEMKEIQKEIDELKASLHHLPGCRPLPQMRQLAFSEWYREPGKVRFVLGVLCYRGPCRRALLWRWTGGGTFRSGFGFLRLHQHGMQRWHSGQRLEVDGTARRHDVGLPSLHQRKRYHWLVPRSLRRRIVHQALLRYRRPARHVAVWQGGEDLR